MTVNEHLTDCLTAAGLKPEQTSLVLRELIKQLRVLSVGKPIPVVTAFELDHPMSETSKRTKILLYGMVVSCTMLYYSPEHNHVDAIYVEKFSGDFYRLFTEAN